jgi:hypothetical protein
MDDAVAGDQRLAPAVRARCVIATFRCKSTAFRRLALHRAYSIDLIGQRERER